MSSSLINTWYRKTEIHPFLNTFIEKWNETFFRNIFSYRFIIKLRTCGWDDYAIRENCTLKGKCETQHENVHQNIETY